MYKLRMLMDILYKIIIYITIIGNKILNYEMVKQIIQDNHSNKMLKIIVYYDFKEEEEEEGKEVQS